MNISSVAKKFADLKWMGAVQAIDHMTIGEKVSKEQLINILNDIAISQENYVLANRQKRLKHAAKLRWPDAMIEQFDYRCETKDVQYVIDKACVISWIDEWYQR